MKTPVSEDMIHVVAGVVREGGLILVARRNPGGPHGGLWEFPGGKVEEGESPEDALARELMDELGISVSVGNLFCEVVHAYPHRTIRLAAYLCEIIGGSLSPIDCAEIVWVKPEDLPLYPMPEADVPIVKKLAGARDGA